MPYICMIKLIFFLYPKENLFFLFDQALEEKFSHVYILFIYFYLLWLTESYISKNLVILLKFIKKLIIFFLKNIIYIFIYFLYLIQKES